LSIMAKRRRRGYSAERELVKKLKERNIWATRIPVSGIGQPLPDVLAVSKGVLHGFEVKTTKGPKKFYKRSFDNTLLWLNAMLNEELKAKAWLAVKFKGNTWRFYPLLEGTENIEANINIGLTFAQLLAELKKGTIR